MKPSVEIAEELHLKMGCNCSAPRYCACNKLISQAIDEARKEAAQEATRSILDRRYGSYMDGKKEAFEKCAEIAEKYRSTEDWDISVAFGIAKAIREEGAK